MMDYNSMRHFGINIQDQTTLETIGHQTLYTIQMILCIMVVQFTDVKLDTDQQLQTNL